MSLLPLHTRVRQLREMLKEACRSQYTNLHMIYWLLRQMPQKYLFVTDVKERMHPSLKEFTCVGPAVQLLHPPHLDACDIIGCGYVTEGIDHTGQDKHH